MSAILRLSSRMPAVKAGAASARRGLASVSTFESKFIRTQTTSLSNGLTIASETIPTAKTATVGVWIESGARSDNQYTNGTANYLEHLIFKGTPNRSQAQLESEIETIGAQLTAETNRESSAFYAQSLKEDVPKTVEIIADALSNVKFEDAAIDAQRQSVLAQASDANKSNKDIVIDHLHAVAFQGQPLGLNVTGPAANVESITETELTNYVKKNFKADRIVLVGAGAVEHEELVQLAEKYLSGLPVSDAPTAPGAGARHPSDTSAFVGSEVRLRDDTIPTANIAIAVEGVSANSPDYYTAQVAKAIIGNWNVVSATANNQGNKLSSIVSQNHLADSFESFSYSYNDTGLWGIYLVSHTITSLDDLVHFALKEWNRLAVSVTPAEIERAKAQLKTALSDGLKTPTDVANDIGSQIVSTGRRQTTQEAERAIDAITEKDVKAWAHKYLWDKDVAISAYGSIEGVLDYQRIRNEMSLMRW
ncbi:hypothetical protein D0Z03_002536 [Geotrichum reessii]|nr:hypothetical protein D0Z03_002536 [Galactomyces reessii]